MATDALRAQAHRGASGTTVPRTRSLQSPGSTLLRPGGRMAEEGSLAAHLPGLQRRAPTPPPRLRRARLPPHPASAGPRAEPPPRTAASDPSAAAPAARNRGKAGRRPRRCPQHAGCLRTPRGKVRGLPGLPKRRGSRLRAPGRRASREW